MYLILYILVDLEVFLILTNRNIRLLVGFFLVPIKSFFRGVKVLRYILIV